MKLTASITILAILGIGGFTVVANASQNNQTVVDTDGDGITDAFDNCTLVSNSDQRDTDGDGYGNNCDADLNNDLIVNAIDLGLFKSRFFTTDPDADLNGDGVVNVIDLGIFRTLFFQPPGPSVVGYLTAPVLDVSGFEGMVGPNFVDLDGSFELSWSASSGATSYTVTQSINGGVPTVVATVLAGDPRLVIFTQVAIGDYVYQVEACDASGLCGPLSASVTVIVENLD